MNNSDYTPKYKMRSLVLEMYQLPSWEELKQEGMAESELKNEHPVFMGAPDWFNDAIKNHEIEFDHRTFTWVGSNDYSEVFCSGDWIGFEGYKSGHFHFMSNKYFRENFERMGQQ